MTDRTTKIIIKSLTTIAFFTLFVSMSSAESGLKNLFPVVGEIPNLTSASKQNVKRPDMVLNKLKNGTRHSQLSDEEKRIYKEYMKIENAWDIISDDDCSWYCGGGPYKVEASSALKPHKGIEYGAKNAHDLSFKTAWVEGAEGLGIGESLTYSFRNQSPRITEIEIYNGYVKSDKAWKENARVKRLRLHVNEVPTAILNLQDTKALQSFKVETLGHREDGRDLILKFEIIEAYPGTKYEDVAITEIFFDGLDVHCFAKGTMVRLANGEEKAIESIVPGDEVLTYDRAGNIFGSSKVTEIEEVFHCNLVKYIFSDGSEVTSTDDHPFLLKKKGWSSYNPAKSRQYSNYDSIEKIEIGDNFLQLDKEGKLISSKLIEIEIIKDRQKTYTIAGLESGDDFFANGFLAGVEELKFEVGDAR